MKDEEEAEEGEEWMTLVHPPDWTRDVAARFTTAVIPYLVMNIESPEISAVKTVAYFRETQKLLRELDQAEGDG